MPTKDLIENKTDEKIKEEAKTISGLPSSQLRFVIPKSPNIKNYKLRLPQNQNSEKHILIKSSRGIYLLSFGAFSGMAETAGRVINIKKNTKEYREHLYEQKFDQYKNDLICELKRRGADKDFIYSEINDVVINNGLRNNISVSDMASAILL